MNDQEIRVTLNEGQSGWYAVFPHPGVSGRDGQANPCVRRELGTRDEAEAIRLSEQLTQILNDSTYWSLEARSRAMDEFDEHVVAVFYDCLTPENRDGWAERERVFAFYPPEMRGMPGCN